MALKHPVKLLLRNVLFTDHVKHKTINKKTICRIPLANLRQLKRF